MPLFDIHLGSIVLFPILEGMLFILFDLILFFNYTKYYMVQDQNYGKVHSHKFHFHTCPILCLLPHLIGNHF